MRIVGALAGALVALAAAGPANAQERFPARPIELIVPTPPGGGVDIVARLIGELAEPILGVKIVVLNKPGASGAIGVTQLAQSRADGYTLAAVWNAPLTITPHTLAVAYGPDDYVPVTQLTGGTPFVFCARPDFPAANGKEFLELLRRNPGRYNYGNDGTGSSVQLAAERAFGKLGVRMRPVPFGGAGETAKNLLGGHIDVYGGTIPTILEHVKAGAVKCLLITSPERSQAMPDATSLGELGAAETASDLWRGIIAPKALPADRLAVLEKGFRQAAQSRRFADFVASRGEAVVASSAPAFAKVVRAESEVNAEILKRLGLARK